MPGPTGIVAEGVYKGIQYGVKSLSHINFSTILFDFDKAAQDAFIRTEGKSATELSFIGKLGAKLIVALDKLLESLGIRSLKVGEMLKTAGESLDKLGSKVKEIIFPSAESLEGAKPAAPAATAAKPLDPDGIKPALPGSIPKVEPVKGSKEWIAKYVEGKSPSSPAVTSKTEETIFPEAEALKGEQKPVVAASTSTPSKTDEVIFPEAPKAETPTGKSIPLARTFQDHLDSNQAKNIVHVDMRNIGGDVKDNYIHAGDIHNAGPKSFFEKTAAQRAEDEKLFEEMRDGMLGDVKTEQPNTVDYKKLYDQEMAKGPKANSEVY